MTEKSAWRQVVRALKAWDAEVFRRTAARRSPALDGEIGPGPAELSFGTARRALTVYRPLAQGLL